MHPTQSHRTRKWRRSPKGKYAMQKHYAKRRGIPFRLTFSEWWAIWDASGHWSQRGNKKGNWVMGRLGDEGAYEVSNVVIITFEENALQSYYKRWA